MVKFTKYLLLLLVAIYLCIWTFNHIDAWLGVGITVGLLFILLRIADKKIKNMFDNNDYN